MPAKKKSKSQAKRKVAKKKTTKRVSSRKRAGAKKVTKKKSGKKSSSKSQVKKEVKVPAKLAKYLVAKKAKFEPVEHRTVYTTFDTAMTLKVEPATVAKTLLVETDRDLIMTVIPGDKNLDFNLLKKKLNEEFAKRDWPKVKKVKLASEKTIEKKFTKSPGALPPFGEIYDIETFVDRGLQKPKRLILSAGEFILSISMSPAEYMRVCEAVTGNFSKKR